jgi:TolA-binding protein
MANASGPAEAATTVDARCPSALLQKFREDLPLDPIRGEIERLRAEQQKQRQERKSIVKQMKNAKRRQQRLKSRARMMTDEDLVSVLMMRKNEKEARAAARDGVGAEPNPSARGPIEPPAPKPAANPSLPPSPAPAFDDDERRDDGVEE